MIWLLFKDIERYSLQAAHASLFWQSQYSLYSQWIYRWIMQNTTRSGCFARRFQVQERLTQDVLECINRTLRPQGMALVIETSHMCMMMRRVQTQNSVTTTSGVRGPFERIGTRNAFLKLMGSDLC